MPDSKPRRWLLLVIVVHGFLALVTDIAGAQDFTAQLDPNPVRLVPGDGPRPVTVSTMVTVDFSEGIVYAFSGFPPGISTGGTQIVQDPYDPVTFSFSAGPNVADGTLTGVLTGTTVDGTITRSFPLTVIVERPDFVLTLNPPSISLSPGGSASVTVRVNRIGALTGVVSITASTVPALVVDPASFDVPAGGSRTVTVRALPQATGGIVQSTFVASSSEVSGTRTASLQVQIASPPPPPPPPPISDFSLSASPNTVTLGPGETSSFQVSATASEGFSGSIEVSGSANPSLALEPSSFPLTAGGAQTVVVTVSPSATPGPIPVTFTGAAGGIPGSRTALATVIVAPGSAPAIHSITPPAVVTGTTGNVLRISGEGFEPGATITSGSAGVIATGTRILGPGAAEVVVAVRPDASPGPHPLDLQNPDGGTATGNAMLLVYPAGALSAPLAVTAAMIMTPRDWQILEQDARVHAHALFATTGMGTIVGTWVLDGVPFDRFTRVAASGFPVEVRSTIPIPHSFTGEHRLELVIESPASLPPLKVPFFQAVESRSGLRILAPDADTYLEPAASVFRWTLVPGATGYEVEVRDAPEEGEPSRTSIRRRITETEWRPEESLIRTLGSGPKRFRVRAVFPGEIRGDPTPWRGFSIPDPDDGSSAAPPSRHATAPGATLRLASTLPVEKEDDASGLPRSRSDDGEPGGELALTLLSTTTTTASEFEDPPPLTRLQLSTQTDFRGAVLDQQATADLSGSHDIEDPWDAREESRNWLTRLGATVGRFRQEGSIGFAPPSFFDQTEFLTVAVSGGGLQGTLDSPLGKLSYYRSVDLSANDQFHAFDPDLDAAAYEAGDAGGRFLFRAMALRATDPEVEGFDPGGEGKALGFIAVADLGPRLRLLGEAAEGDFDPAEGSFEGGRDGRAFRLTLGGGTGTFGYAFVVGRTGEGFINPANRGFTPGGVSDRTRAELSLQKRFGQASLSGRYGHVRGGIPAATGDPTTREHGVGLQLTFPLHPRATLSTGTNLTAQRGDAVDDLGLPATDRTQRGFDLGLAERLGPFSLGQTLTWQDFTDRSQPLSDQSVTGVSVFASGNAAEFLGLSGNVAHTRTKAAPEIGTTNQLLISLQPSLTLARAWIALVPRAAWMRVSNDFQETAFRSDQYQIVLRWSPPWAGALLHLEVASDWNRTWAAPDLDPPSFDRQTVLTLSLNWRADRLRQPGNPSLTTPSQVAFAHPQHQEVR